MFSAASYKTSPQSRYDNLRFSENRALQSRCHSLEVTPLLGYTHDIRRTPGTLAQPTPISNSQPKSTFTFRALAIGLVLGTIICPMNIYFGLKTGRVTGFPLATALIANFIACRFGPPLSLQENIFVVAVATALAAMPITAALVGVIPALEYLVVPQERGPLEISWFRLLIWSVGVCVFGPFLAVCISRHFAVLKELPFPPGTATAILIKRLHAKSTGQNTSTRPPFEDNHNDEVDSSGIEHEHREVGSSGRCS